LFPLLSSEIVTSINEHISSSFSLSQNITTGSIWGTVVRYYYYYYCYYCH